MYRNELQGDGVGAPGNLKRHKDKAEKRELKKLQLIKAKEGFPQANWCMC